MPPLSMQNRCDFLFQNETIGQYTNLHTIMQNKVWTERRHCHARTPQSHNIIVDSMINTKFASSTKHKVVQFMAIFQRVSVIVCLLKAGFLGTANNRYLFGVMEHHQ